MAAYAEKAIKDRNILAMKTALEKAVEKSKKVGA